MILAEPYTMVAHIPGKPAIVYSKYGVIHGSVISLGA